MSRLTPFVGAATLTRLLPFLAWRHRVTKLTLRADLLAGFVGACVVLPQGIAYATLAGLPPQYGLFSAIVPVIVAALWGSSWHQVSGPTNTMALAVFAIVTPLAIPGSDPYIKLVLTLMLMLGLIQLALGVARLGAMVNFISNTVIVGFTAGAGLLIIVGQIANFFGVTIAADADIVQTGARLVGQWRNVDPATLGVGVMTMAAAFAGRRFFPQIPYMITGLIAGTLLAWLLARFGIAHVRTIGALPSAIPQLSMPSFDFADWRHLAPGALALTALALAQAVSVARAVATKSGQRLDGNQEFIGQGLSNVAGAFTSCFPTSGSFNRIWVNFEAGARTPLAAVFSGVFLLLLLLVLAPFAALLPFATMAGLLFIVAWGLIDFAQIRNIARTQSAEAWVLAITLTATLTIQLEFAILVGVLASFFVYLQRTTRPRVMRIAANPSTPESPDGESATARRQVDIVRIDGSLFFGATDHVRDRLDAVRVERPAARHVLLMLSGVNFIDVAGAELLAEFANALRQQGATLWMAHLRSSVREVLQRGGYLQAIGAQHAFDDEADALHAIHAEIDVQQAPAPAPD
ncbi:MAG: SulP family inorganic anion transporter [Casimicrobiaceae bacterium]